mmetsp:Transcript_23925/g.66496  ORF Transcript_23925/g.66496 Transcript_23925/m.66496 type:complete len:93 (-) Transcript_23925:136-414(-)
MPTSARSARTKGNSMTRLLSGSADRPSSACSRRKKLNCITGSKDECPPERKMHYYDSNFDGLHYGLFEPGPERKAIGWPRFADCHDWGCASL